MKTIGLYVIRFCNRVSGILMNFVGVNVLVVSKLCMAVLFYTVQAMRCFVKQQKLKLFKSLD
jgi:hypothetical protein